MDFRYSTEQDDFRASLRGFLGRGAPVREMAAADGSDRRLWQRLCTELELPALHVPPEHGGLGATLVETAIAFAELGRALTPIPFAATVFAIEAILRMGDDEQRKRLLAGLLTGARIGTIAVSGHDVASATTVRAVRRDGRPALTGECTPVLHGHVADLFVVPAVADGSIVLHVVAADAPGVTVTPLPSFDITRPVATLRLAGSPAEPLTAGTPDDMERVLDVARVLLAAEMLGGAEACLDLAVQYAGRRTQFDRPIGSFQAVKHACADMMIEIDATRATVMFAAMSAANGDELQTVAPLAKAQTAETFVLCAGSALQIHGAIAFTWEHDLHLYYRRAKTTEAPFREQRSKSCAARRTRGACESLGAQRGQRRFVVGFLRDFRHQFRVGDVAVRADHHDCAGEQPGHRPVGDGHAVILAEAVPECRRGHDVFGALGAAEALLGERQILRDTQHGSATCRRTLVEGSHTRRAHRCVHGWKDVQQHGLTPELVAADHPQIAPGQGEGRGRGSDSR